jgi:2-polyprenyl-6-methoxyphenol hydroxylase-like FAD-dependent oxidoreductase
MPVRISRTQVLIVGAGPTGLVLAAELHRRGTGFRIIDKHPGVLEATKAAALHGRALEYFRDLGVADRIVAEGQRVDILTLRTGYRDRLGVDFRVSRDTRYPHMVDIPQARTEHILLDHLTGLGVPVERGTTLTGLRQTGDGVEATVVTDADTETGCAARYATCSGWSSPARTTPTTGCCATPSSTGRCRATR